MLRPGVMRKLRASAEAADRVQGNKGTDSAQIDAIKKQYAVYSAKVPQPGGDYSIDHTASVFLMDRGGAFVATLAPDESDDVALAKLKRIAG